MEKYGKNGRFSGRLRPDWGSTAWAATAGLGSIGRDTLEVEATKLSANLYLVNSINDFSNCIHVSLVPVLQHSAWGFNCYILILLG